MSPSCCAATHPFAATHFAAPPVRNSKPSTAPMNWHSRSGANPWGRLPRPTRLLPPTRVVSSRKLLLEDKP